MNLFELKGALYEEFHAMVNPLSEQYSALLYDPKYKDIATSYNTLLHWYFVEGKADKLSILLDRIVDFDTRISFLTTLNNLCLSISGDYYVIIYNTQGNPVIEYKSLANNHFRNTPLTPETLAKAIEYYT